MSGRLLAWLVMIGSLILLNYVERASSGGPDRNAVYHWSTAAGGFVFYLLFFGLVLLISREQTQELLALRQPRSWSQALKIAGLVVAAVVILEVALEPLLHANREQGLTPKHWEAAHAAPFVANFVVLVLIGPFVEEATFRGLGYSLLVTYGQIVAIVVTSVLFGLSHGLVDGLPVLVALGIGLAYLRARSDSLYPGFLVHALFNALALILAVA
jgi:membrane protease YdiL (CAAX protease family)